MSSERKQFKEQKEEAEKFNQLLKDQAGIKLQHFLWQLFHVDREIDELKKQREGSTEKLESEQGILSSCETHLSSQKKEQARSTKECVAAEKQQAALEKTLEASRPKVLEVNEKRTHS